jgi:hypothetical protein
MSDELGAFVMELPKEESQPQERQQQQTTQQLQQRPLQGDALNDMNFLCFANIPPPGPQVREVCTNDVHSYFLEEI